MLSGHRGAIRGWNPPPQWMLGLPPFTCLRAAEAGHKLWGAFDVGLRLGGPWPGHYHVHTLQGRREGEAAEDADRLQRLFLWVGEELRGWL